MEKRSPQTPDEVAKDLENNDFAEIEDDELKKVFGSLSAEESDCNCGCSTNLNCDIS